MYKKFTYKKDIEEYLRELGFTVNDSKEVIKRLPQFPITEFEVLRSASQFAGENLTSLRKSNAAHKNWSGTFKQQRDDAENKLLELGRKLEETSKKLTEWENSEILKLGKSIFNAFKKTGNERKHELLEYDLVHKEDYNTSVLNLKDVIKEQNAGISAVTKDAKQIIGELERKIDTLRSQLASIESYIKNNYGVKKWNEIKNYFKE